MFNKDLDRLFQEKFKDFEETPSNTVWSEISKELDNKPKSFLFLKLTSVVAVFMLISGLIWYFNVEKSIPEKGKNKINDIVKKDKILNKDTKFNSNSNIVVTEENTATKDDDNSNSTANNNSKAIQKLILTKNKIQNKTVDKKSAKIKSNIIVNSVLTQTNSQKATQLLTLNNVNTDKNTQRKLQISSVKSILKNDNSMSLTTKNIVLIKTLNTLVLADLSKYKLDINKSIPIETKLNKSYKKWAVGPEMTTIHYGSFSKGSPLDSHIAQNEQVSSNSYAYGFNVGYQLNKKWSLKTGINKRNLSYKTKDVGVVFQVVSIGGNFETANLNSERGDIALHSMQGANQTQDVTFIGDVKQEMNYIEVPLEFAYNLVDKKIGVALNGGFSTLFLNQNKVTFERVSSDFALGEASNINKTSYSINIGFDTSLRLSDNLEYSISPLFKYHINTFSENDGGFKPYSLGLNTGLYYKF